MENLSTQGVVSDSKNSENSKFHINIKKESVYVLLFLALVNWVSHFLYFKRFGLYEDDYGNIPQHFDENFPELIQYIISRLTYWIQGHPFAFLPGLFTFVGKEINEGIAILYVFAFIIITINSFLMYKILRKIFPVSELFAISGALIFCLFPPDTTKLYLLHVFVAQMTLMFFFTATLFYLKNKKILAYLTIILTILTWEAPFMVFFGVPFLQGNWDKKFRKEYLKHFIILSSMILFMFFYRKLTGETRVLEASSDMIGVITKAIAALFIGPAFNIFLFLRAPVVTINYLLSGIPLFWWYYDYIYYILLACFLYFLWLFSKLKSDYHSSLATKSISTGTYSLLMENDISVNEYFKKLFKIFIAGIILLCFAYSVSFTHYPPIALMGRGTSVHMAASFGGSIIFACICAAIFFISEKYNFKKLAVVTLSLYFALLVGYNTYTQKEFVVSWGYQRDFWKKMLELVPDLKENTIVLVDGNYRLPDTRYIYSHHLWNDMLVFDRLFNFPKEWKIPPKLFMVYGKWEENSIKVENNEFKLKLPFPPNLLPLQDSNVVLIDYTKNKEFVRIDSSLTINGNTLYLKPKSESTLDSFKKKKLYDYLIDSK